MSIVKAIKNFLTYNTDENMWNRIDNEKKIEWELSARRLKEICDIYCSYPIGFLLGDEQNIELEEDFENLSSKLYSIWPYKIQWITDCRNRFATIKSGKVSDRKKKMKSRGESK